MRLFFVLVCCLAIPLVARAANEDNNKAKSQATQGHQQQSQHQPQAGTQSKHYGASTASRVSSSSRSKVQSQHHALTQNNNARVVQSSTKGKVGAQKSNVRAVQSSTRGQVQSKHFALSNSRNPNIASAKFNRNYRIQGSQNWRGQQYGAFQNYRDNWHDQGWWNNHYNRIVLIGGGWYFWNAGYWYPA